MGLEFTGDWDKFRNLENIERAMQDHMGDALETAGELLRGNIVKGIRNQKFDFAPLAESTKKTKIRDNKSPLILIREGDYLASFAVKREGWDKVHVGSNHPQGRALEHGYEPGNLPARPHVAPALGESAEEILDTLGNGLATVFESIAP